MEEIFKQLPGTPYYISNLGNVYSMRVKRLIKPQQNDKGYLKINFMHTRADRKQLFVHLKVVELFGDKNGNHFPQNATSIIALGLSVDHVDCNKNNNSVSNLEIVTHSENLHRMWQHKRQIEQQTNDLAEIFG